MSSINKLFNRIYEKIPGSYWGIIGGLFGLIMFSLGIFLHSLTEPISFFYHWVSHLGWGPNGSELVFRIGLIILECFIIPFVFFLRRILKTNGDTKVAENEENEEEKSKIKMKEIFTNCAFITAIIALIGLFLVSIFGNIGQREFIVHLLGATIFFLLIMFSILFFTVAMIIDGKMNKIQLIMTTIVFIIFISFGISAIPPLQNFDTVLDFLLNYQNWSYEDRIIALENMVPFTNWFTFFEWIYAFSHCFWFIIVGFSTSKYNGYLEV